MFLNFLKPFVCLWAGLNFIDDLSIVLKVARLVGAHSRNQSPEKICDLCDDVMENLLRGSEGLEAIPCSWICLGTPKCMNMCEKMQELTDKSGEFPCIAAGYCPPDDNDYAGFANEVDCKRGPLFSCEPRKFCRKTRPKYSFNYTCDLKPGIGRWIHMKKIAHKHMTAVAAGLLDQKRCGEPDAGPYCIAKPSGFGRLAEFLAWSLSILYGVYASIVAIETPGGDDDQQWLTFWVIFVALMLLEQTFALVLLSKFPFYYEVKLVFIVWLIFFDGAATGYRWLRNRMSQWIPSFASMLHSNNQRNAKNTLNRIINIGGTPITDQMALLERNLKCNIKKRYSYMFTQSPAIDTFWEYDYSDVKPGTNRASLDAEEMLYQISKWLLSREGMQKIEDQLDSKTSSFIFERAAAVIFFQPKFLNIHLKSTKPGVGGRLPIMDPNGKADCYVKFALTSDKERYLQNVISKPHVGGTYMKLRERIKLRCLNQSVTSSIAYRTIEPVWNQILEIPIVDGTLGEDGTYRNHDIEDMILLVEAWDADCGKWGIALEVFRILGCYSICSLAVAYVVGATDFVFNEKLSTEEWWWKTIITASTLCVAVGMVLSWMMSVVLRADDAFIGNSAVPLEILNDRRGHSLMLKLRKKRAERGILRVKVSLSEN